MHYKCIYNNDDSTSSIQHANSLAHITTVAVYYNICEARSTLGVNQM